MQKQVMGKSAIFKYKKIVERSSFCHNEESYLGFYSIFLL